MYPGGVSAFLKPSLSRHNPVEGSEIPYDQNGNDAGTVINSQNFLTSYYDNQAADDFVIPRGNTWTITEVDVTREYFSGSGSATSENVVYCDNKYGIPGSYRAHQ
jgi:hypothetical protein